MNTRKRSRSLSSLKLYSLISVALLGAWVSSSYAESFKPRVAQNSSATPSAWEQLRVDVLGLRFLYGQTELSAQDAGAHGRHEQLFGSAISLEWAILHHYLELEVIMGGFEHEGAYDEFAELVVKAPIHFGRRVDLLFGAGVIGETHHQQPLLGVTTDVNLRFWTSHHWGLSAELDYVMLESGSTSTEWIAELLYRF